MYDIQLSERNIVHCRATLFSTITPAFLQRYLHFLYQRKSGWMLNNAACQFSGLLC